MLSEHRNNRKQCKTSQKNPDGYQSEVSDLRGHTFPKLLPGWPGTGTGVGVPQLERVPDSDDRVDTNSNEGQYREERHNAKERVHGRKLWKVGVNRKSDDYFVGVGFGASSIAEPTTKPL
jgi:hypothetical protein